MIRVDDVSKRFTLPGAKLGARGASSSSYSCETLTVLDHITFQIERGEWVALTGPSGSGKTTLLRLIAGLDIPTSGRVLFNEQDLGALTEDERALIRARQMGFVFQNYQLIESLSALENVMLPYEILPASERPTLLLRQERARELLSNVGMSARESHRPSELSGGESQRVAIARALITSPDLLIADEPTGNLDSKTGETILDLLWSLRDQRKNTAHPLSALIVTHHPELARRADREISLK